MRIGPALLLAVSLVDAQALPASAPQTLPLLVSAEVPLYPVLALAARLSGTVRVKLQVNNGVVVNTETNSSAHMILVNAAEKTVRTWRFASDATGAFELTFIYQLEAEEGGLPENPRVEIALPVVKITGRPVKRTTVR